MSKVLAPENMYIGRLSAEQPYVDFESGAKKILDEILLIYSWCVEMLHNAHDSEKFYNFAKSAHKRMDIKRDEIKRTDGAEHALNRLDIMFRDDLNFTAKMIQDCFAQFMEIYSILLKDRISEMKVRFGINLEFVIHLTHIGKKAKTIDQLLEQPYTETPNIHNGEISLEQQQLLRGKRQK